MSQKALVQHLITNGALKSEQLIKSFRKVDRADFVPEEYRRLAYVDEPLPIGEGQTISQPSTVAFMMELLQPMPGQKVLDVGFGSGWTTALLAVVVGKSGRVYAVELRERVYAFGVENLKRARCENIEYILGRGQMGLLEVAPFDRILVSAAAGRVPEELISQLAPGGRMVVPLITGRGQSIVLFEKDKKGSLSKTEYPGFVFVPFVTD